MLAGGPEKAGLARDTIFAALMIIVNGVVGISVLVGALAHGEQSFRIEGAGPALAALVTLATLSLVLPTLTTHFLGSDILRGPVAVRRCGLLHPVGPVPIRADGTPPRLLSAHGRYRG